MLHLPHMVTVEIQWGEDGVGTLVVTSASPVGSTPGETFFSDSKDGGVPVYRAEPRFDPSTRRVVVRRSFELVVQFPLVLHVTAEGGVEVGWEAGTKAE